MTREEIFLTKSRDKYLNKYNYSKFIFKNAKTKSIIICPIHGEFLQHPELHLNSTYGCPKCSIIGRGLTASNDYKENKRKLKSSKYSKNEMQKLLQTKFLKYSFDLSNYKGLVDNKISLICPDHGITEALPGNLLKSVSGCNKCSRISSQNKMTNSYDKIIIKFREAHKDKYSYPEENRNDYINLKQSSLKIICPIHGEFEKIGYRHMKGHGCFKCLCEEIIASGGWPGGYNEKNFARSDSLKNKKAIIYYLKIGEYYKIGITINLNRRISSLKFKSKLPIEKIFISTMRLYDAYLLEQKLLKKYKDKRVITKWSTELFLENVIEEYELKI